MRWLIAGGAVTYLVGALFAFRLLYRREVDKIYKARLVCERCNTYLNRFSRGESSYTVCNHHEGISGDAVIEKIASGTVLWPFVVVGIGGYFSGKFLSKIARAKISTKSMVQWEEKLKVALVKQENLELMKRLEEMGEDPQKLLALEATEAVTSVTVCHCEAKVSPSGSRTVY